MVMNIRGVAVTAGLSRNGIIYTPEELEKFTPTLADKPILKDHMATTDNTIGRTKETFFSKDSTQYTGWIKDSSAEERIADGRINRVSIGAIAGRLVKEDEDSENYIAKDLHGMELSTTPTPGVRGTSITQCLKQLGEADTPEKRLKIKPIAENISLFENLDKIKEKEVCKMAEENETKVDEQPEEAKVETKEEETKAEEKVVNQKVSVDIDTSKLDEALEKTAKLIEMKKQLTEQEPEPAEEPAKEKPVEKEEPVEKGEVSDEETETNEDVSGYVLEKTEQGKLALWKER